MAKTNAHLKIFRYDPEADECPRYDEYSVPYVEGDTVLDLLNYVYENCDQSLAYRSACRKGKCGSCPVLVNGQAAFSCREPAAPELVIEPHPKFRLIRDLVVDFDHQTGET
jgi:succinate dehydrogenase / fumarate reductase iron-sulfur subunit